MEDKYYWFMFCYYWQANNQSGNGSKILSGDSSDLNNRDINDVISHCKEFVGKQMHHDKDSVQIIFTNIIRLNHCTNSEFYKKDDD